eukprot:7775062-Pyramimonas_sp.AAC.1
MEHVGRVYEGMLWLAVQPISLSQPPDDNMSAVIATNEGVRLVTQSESGFFWNQQEAPSCQPHSESSGTQFWRRCTILRRSKDAYITLELQHCQPKVRVYTFERSTSTVTTLFRANGVVWCWCPFALAEVKKLRPHLFELVSAPVLPAAWLRVVYHTVRPGPVSTSICLQVADPDSGAC